MTSQATGDLRTTIGVNIRSARTAREMTQRNLAHAIDVDSMLVSKWERGANRPSDTNMAALADALGVDVPWLYTDHGKSAVAA